MTKLSVPPLLRARSGRPLRAMLAAVATAALVAAAACDGTHDASSPPGATGETAEPTHPVRPALLLAQAQFTEAVDSTGKRTITPGAAKLMIVRPGEQGWSSEVLEDPDSNVFHKAMPFGVPGEAPGILTIGGNLAPAPALMKLWRKGLSGWQGLLLSGATFGYRFNRFRDVEAGDLTGDGIPELVAGTHDSGVVVVLQRTGERWVATTLDQARNTFVHEVELGDLDGDGLPEVYATPSAPNRMDRGQQPGKIMRYALSGGRWVATTVASFANRHAKEILVADLERRGQPDLYAAIEYPAPAAGPGRTTITRWRESQGVWTSTDVVTLPCESCRFMAAGDVDGDGKAELVAGCGRAGIWLLRPGPPPWSGMLVDDASTAVELATALADLDGDGTREIYVAADDQHVLRRYRWRAPGFERTALVELGASDMTFSLEPWLDPQTVGGS